MLPYELASPLLYRNLSLLIQMHAYHRDIYKIKRKQKLFRASLFHDIKDL